MKLILWCLDDELVCRGSKQFKIALTSAVDVRGITRQQVIEGMVSTLTAARAPAGAFIGETTFQTSKERRLFGTVICGENRHELGYAIKAARFSKAALKLERILHLGVTSSPSAI